MNADLPVWAALLVAFFLIAGSGLTLIGAIGAVRLGSFYQRVHAPTLGTTWGVGGILIASMIFFSVAEGRPVLHEVLIAAFVIVTTPVTLMLLVRAALYRDRSEGVADAPGFEELSEQPVEPDGPR
jgi:multicomponent K+:H+ antiporter subunit G